MNMKVGGIQEKRTKNSKISELIFMLFFTIGVVKRTGLEPATPA